MYRIAEILYYILKTNIILYVNYTGKEKKEEEEKKGKKRKDVLKGSQRFIMAFPRAQ